MYVYLCFISICNQFLVLSFRLLCKRIQKRFACMKVEKPREFVMENL